MSRLTKTLGFPLTLENETVKTGGPLELACQHCRKVRNPAFLPLFLINACTDPSGVQNIKIFFFVPIPSLRFFAAVKIAMFGETGIPKPRGMPKKAQLPRKKIMYGDDSQFIRFGFS